MIKYKAISDTEFVKIVDIHTSIDEANIFANGTQEEKLVLIADLEERFADVILEGSELSEIETIYNSYKPTLKEGDVYKLISFELALDNGIEGVRMGAYNYKLNNNIINVILK